MTEKAPLISVIIPTHNRADLVKRAIKSVLEQTYQTFELIVVDDSSTDNTSEAIKSFDDSRINYTCHEKNRGGSAARNTGIKTAIGKYIAFLDDDDEWKKEKLELQVAKLQEKNGIMVSCDILAIRGKEKNVRTNNKIEYTLEDLLWGNMVGSTSVIMVENNLANSILFDEALTAAQDYDFYVRCLEEGDEPIYNINKPLAKIHRHGKKRITTSGNKKYEGNRRFILKHTYKMSEAQRRYHFYKYRLLEWPRNPGRSFRFLYKGLLLHPWWRSWKEWKKVLRVFIDGLKTRYLT